MLSTNLQLPAPKLILQTPKALPPCARQSIKRIKSFYNPCFYIAGFAKLIDLFRECTRSYEFGCSNVYSSISASRDATLTRG